MIKLFTERFCIKLDNSSSFYTNQVLKNDYLTSDICFKIGKRMAKLNFNSSNFNVFEDIILYVSSICSITSTSNSTYCILNVAVCLK